jgi:hypothetical protein
MRDAHTLRAQAELCLTIARETSDAKAAENLRAEAARDPAEAGDIEGMQPSTPPMLAKEN